MMAKDGDDRAQRLERERESLEARVRDQTVKIQGLTSQLAEARISQTKSQQAEQQVQEVRFVCVCIFLTKKNCNSNTDNPTNRSWKWQRRNVCEA